MSSRVFSQPSTRMEHALSIYLCPTASVLFNRLVLACGFWKKIMGDLNKLMMAKLSYVGKVVVYCCCVNVGDTKPHILYLFYNQSSLGCYYFYL